MVFSFHAKVFIRVEMCHSEWALSAVEVHFRIPLKKYDENLKQVQVDATEGMDSVSSTE
ncbi:hypothetical protein [Flagellimonas onchidii]|uniref:hypothetical protein n=1 Tax=Flagellimonas onchidii TaxID=2562684 RepID=UPI001455E460|nr:hypothetical protein [Allomuricauda onchidii]